jgi:hypothetical protein
MSPPIATAGLLYVGISAYGTLEAELHKKMIVARYKKI